MIKLKNPLLIVGLVYFLSRLINLTIIPVFVDEAIYTRWSQVMASDPKQWAIPLSDGKQPLFMWLGAILQKITPDPLFGERLISVVAGFFTMLLLYLFVKELVDKRAGIIAATLYIVCPFTFFYDRLAVADGLLTTFFVLIALTSLRFIKKPSISNAMVLGLSLGGGLMTKSTAGLSLFLFPPTLLFFDWKKKEFSQRLGKLILLGAIALGLAGLIYYSLKLSPLFYLISQRTPDFIFTPKEILKHPWDPFQFRISEVLNWLIGYLTLPIFASAFLGAVLFAKKDWKRALYLTAWFLLPLLIEMEIAKGFTPRYFIFITPFALALAAYTVNLLLSKKKLLGLIVGFAIVIPAVNFEFLLTTNPEKAPIPQKEKQGYLEDWSAGYGVKEISLYLKQKAVEGKPITVGTEGTQGYGTLPDGLEIYLRDVKNITVVGKGQQAEIYSVPVDLISDSKVHPAYLVVNENRLLDKQNPHLKLVANFPKSNGLNPLLLYQITP